MEIFKYARRGSSLRYIFIDPVSTDVLNFPTKGISQSLVVASLGIGKLYGISFSVEALVVAISRLP